MPYESRTQKDILDRIPAQRISPALRAKLEKIKNISHGKTVDELLVKLQNGESIDENSHPWLEDIQIQSLMLRKIIPIPHHILRGQMCKICSQARIMRMNYNKAQKELKAKR